MKEIFLFTCLLLAGITAKSQSLTDSLIANYSFDDSTARDQTFHKHDGMLKGNPKIVNGVKGAAMSFNGKSDYVAITDKPYLRMDTGDAWSISVWYNNNNVSGNMQHQDVIFKGGTSSTTTDYTIFMENNVLMWGSGVSSDTGTWMKTPRPATFKWHHVVVTSKKIYVNLGHVTAYEKMVYVDNALRKKDTGYVKAQGITDTLFLAHSFDTKYGNNYFPGMIDEVRIYKRVLNTTDVNKLYNFNYNGIDCNRIGKVGTKFYPNPMEKQSTIELNLKEKKHMSIVAYDIMGKQVATIANTNYPEGTTFINIYDNLFPASGNYFLKIITDNESICQKVVVVK
ncbi:MAG: T9SS type A sorting domain-containing protein [Bacteroidetes bacterium]|nr:T9SS type A sorting domain-containing protein [Bacteroidota bacterium]